MTLDERVEAFGGALSMREAIALGPLEWLTRQLVETDGSRARLRFWQEAGRPEGPFVPNVAALSGLLFDATTTVFQHLPPPVAWHASARVVVLGMDSPVAGFSAYAPKLSAATFDEQTQVVVVDCRCKATDLLGLLAHEIAHCWTRVVQSRERAFSSAHYQQVRALASSIAAAPTDDQSYLLLALARQEELAHVLAHQWGFSGHAADPVGIKAHALAYVKQGCRV